MQPLSAEEMASRHILGRLYGPIATCVESTRNDRLYNRPLWEKALLDEVFLEKVATKALFLELGHPADREETDMKQACACIPEVPKIVGDDLYAYVDILDTPNGRLLKTLVDYGFVPGISSRGSGDVLENNQVDPETFFLETWDIVQLPAVKKARLSVCESLDSGERKLKKALIESYKAAKEDDKETMKKALKNLNINIEQELTEEVAAVDGVEKVDSDSSIQEASEDKKVGFVPWNSSEELRDRVLVEDSEEPEESEENAAEESEELTDEIIEDDTVEVVTEIEDDVEADDIEAGTEPETESKVISQGDAAAEVKNVFKEISSEGEIEISPITVGEITYDVNNISITVENEKVIIGVNCDAPEEEVLEEPIEEAETDTDIDSEKDEKAEEETESAEDDGDAEVIESLKEVVRQKDALEEELSDLRKAKAVGDTKVLELQEKLSRYRQAFTKLNEKASKVSQLEAEVKTLSEKLTQSKTNVKALTEQVNKGKQLKESLNSNKDELKRLTEEATDLKTKLEGQSKAYKAKLQEKTNLVNKYKAYFIETMNKYVESKASMLGVKPSEITSRLNESYTLADIDAVCDEILDSTFSYGRLPFSGRTKASARISESVDKKHKTTDLAYGYEIDDSLLELAGLKKNY